MSFGLAKGRDLDTTGVGVTDAELPPLPDSILADPESGRVDLRAWFPNRERPLEIEIGSGKGTFLVSQAPLQPETNFLGIEWAGEFYAYAADRLRRRAVTNVRMLHANGSDFLRWRCPTGIVRVIHLYFSDPWPKRRHHKNRVVQHRFLAEAWRVLEPHGELRVVTDHDELWQWDVERFDIWTDAARYAAWRSADCPDEHVAVPVTAAPPSGASAPFSRHEFVPVACAGDGSLVGTNYEKKMCQQGEQPKAPHAVTLRKRND